MAEGVTPDEEHPEPGTALVPVESTEVEVVEANLLPGPYEARVAQAQRTARRFSFAFALLVGMGVVLVTAVAALIVTRPGQGPAWSAFQPSGDRTARATAIADYVAPRYRLDTGEEIVLAQASPPVVQGNIPIEVIAIVQATANSSSGGYDLLNAAHALTYQLCGLGDKCAIKTGTPSADRERLLRREALELALYSFKYVSGVDSVVVYMPPPAGKSATIALLFRKADFHDELSHPLAVTLPDPVPTPSALAAMPQKQVVESLTASRRYGFSFTQLQDGNAALLLDPSKLSA